jgi:hypothetical protein
VTFQVGDLIALPLQPCIRVLVTPDEVVEVDQIAWETGKDAFIEWALSIPDIAGGLSHRQIRPYVGGNSSLAKLAVALGDLAGIWKRYPSSVEIRELWGQTHPVVMPFSPSVKARAVPKPSAGELDATAKCACCSRGMGPASSKVHDRIESLELNGLCSDCDYVCGYGARECSLIKRKSTKVMEKRAEPSEPLQDDQEVVDIAGAEFERYADMFKED